MESEMYASSSEAQVVPVEAISLETMQTSESQRRARGHTDDVGAPRGTNSPTRGKPRPDTAILRE